MQVKKGFFYQLAMSYGGLSSYEAEDTNVCSFMRKVLLGFVAITLISLFSAAFLSPAAMGLTYLAAGLVHGFVYPPEELLIGLLLYVVIGSYVGLLYGTSRYKQWKRNKRYAAEARMYELMEKGEWIEPEAPKPGVLTVWYRSFKEKTCFRISFTD